MNPTDKRVNQLRDSLMIGDQPLKDALTCCVFTAWEETFYRNAPEEKETLSALSLELRSREPAEELTEVRRTYHDVADALERLAALKQFHPGFIMGYVRRPEGDYVQLVTLFNAPFLSKEMPAHQAVISDLNFRIDGMPGTKEGAFQ